MKAKLLITGAGSRGIMTIPHSFCEWEPSCTKDGEEYFLSRLSYYKATSVR